LNDDHAPFFFIVIVPNALFFHLSIHSRVGHWLGLYHVFAGDCSKADGDGISDTAAQLSHWDEYDWRDDCYVGVAVDSCPGLPGKDDPNNFMNYQWYQCTEKYGHFTPGQKEYMEGVYNLYRKLGDHISYRIVVQYDRYPAQTSWVVRDVTRGSNVGQVTSRASRRYRRFKKVVQKDREFYPGNQYAVTLRDKKGNGFTKGRAGYLSIQAVDKRIWSAVVWEKKVTGRFRRKQKVVKFLMPQL